MFEKEQKNIYPNIVPIFTKMGNYLQRSSYSVQQYINLLIEIANIHNQYSEKLFKAQNQLNKAVLHKKQYEKTIEIMKKILYTKSDEAKNISISIIQDLIPYLKENLKKQKSQIEQFKSKYEKEVKGIKNEILKLLNICQEHKKDYLKMQKEKYKFCVKPNPLYISENQLKKQKQINQFIFNYNQTVNQYLQLLIKIEQKFIYLQYQIKNLVINSINKYIVTQMSNIKNQQYTISRLSNENETKYDKFEFKIDYGQPSDIVVCKINSQNLFEQLKNEVFHSHMQEIINIQTIFKDNKQADQNQFQNLINLLYIILNTINKNYDFVNLKKIINLSSQIFKKVKDVINNKQKKVFAIESIYQHELFMKNDFWENYITQLQQNYSQEADQSRRNQILTNQMRLIGSIKLQQNVLLKILDRFHELANKN